MDWRAILPTFRYDDRKTLVMEHPRHILALRIEVLKKMLNKCLRVLT